MNMNRINKKKNVATLSSVLNITTYITKYRNNNGTKFKGKSETSGVRTSFVLPSYFLVLRWYSPCTSFKGSAMEVQGSTKGVQGMYNEVKGSTLKKKVSHETQEGFMHLKKVS
jgi:hypothetical protein